jgi:hypothetical protein
MPLARKKVPSPSPIVRPEQPRRASLAKILLVAAHLEATRACMSADHARGSELRRYRHDPAKACSDYLGIRVTDADIAAAQALRRRHMQQAAPNDT